VALGYFLHSRTRSVRTKAENLEFFWSKENLELADAITNNLTASVIVLFNLSYNNTK
jgi:hypothetical protein